MGTGRGEEAGPVWTTYSTLGSGEVGAYWAHGSGFSGAVRVSVYTCKLVLCYIVLSTL